MRKNSIKNQRINEEVQRVLGELIRSQVKDPRIAPLTSVVAVEVAPDLKQAKVYVSVLGEEDKVKNTLAGLRSAAPFLRSALAKSVNLRNTPELIFQADQSIAYGIHMSQKIQQVIEKDEKAEQERGESEDVE